MKFVYLYCFSFFAALSANAQSYSLKDLEQMLFTNNGLLIAQKYSINAAAAQIVQAKLLPNPTLEISEVNLWSNATAETMPNIWGAYGKHQQIGLQLEQMIETAGKRKKRVSLAQLEMQDESLEYEALLRELQFELRDAMVQWSRTNAKVKLNQSIIDLYKTLLQQYKRQSDLKNIAKADYLRVQTALAGFQKEQISFVQTGMELLSKLRVITGNENLKENQLQDLKLENNLSIKVPNQLENLAASQNVNLQKQLKNVEISKQQIVIANAERMPNIALQANYDRGGNMMKNFVGIGATVDLPFFNRNQGNIKSAYAKLEEANAQHNYLQSQINNEIDVQFRQLKAYELLLNEWGAADENEQTKMIENYRKHLQTQQISLIEFIDFVEAYQDAQIGYEDLMEQYQRCFTQLQFLAGTDF